MKQIYMQSKSPKSIKDVYSENDQMNFNPKTNRMKSSIASTGDEGKRKAIEHADNSNIFLNQNIGKGPPGRQRSPGGYYADRPPDGGVGLPDEIVTPVGVMNQGKDNPKNISEQQLKYLTFGQKANIPLNTEYQTKTNFYTQLNFTNMKKQILFLAFFILAALASITDSYGQTAIKRTDPRPSTCSADNALHPIAGKAYNYSIGAAGVAPGDGTRYQWWATQQNDFILNSTVNLIGMLTTSTTGELLYAGPGYGVLGDYSTMTITWSSEILAATNSGTVLGTKKPTFVAVKVNNVPTICADNFKVYQLDPINGFLVDIFPVQVTGTSSTTLTAAGATSSNCVSDVASAKFNGTLVDMDYGTTTATFEIVASNFSNNFLPTFRATLHGDQDGILQLAYDPDFTNRIGTDLTLAKGVTTVTASASATTTETNTSAGVSIFARMIIQNHTFETTAVQPVMLAVVAKNSVGQDAVKNSDCTKIQDFTDADDTATHNLLPRPTLTPTTPTPPVFVPANSTN